MKILSRNPRETPRGQGESAAKSRSRPDPNVNVNVRAEGCRIDRELRLIPWREIWRPVSTAKLRGHFGIVDTFFHVLLQESVFDDQGAWWNSNHVSPRREKTRLAA